MIYNTSDMTRFLVRPGPGKKNLFKRKDKIAQRRHAKIVAEFLRRAAPSATYKQFTKDLFRTKRSLVEIAKTKVTQLEKCKQYAKNIFEYRSNLVAYKRELENIKKKTAKLVEAIRRVSQMPDENISKAEALAKLEAQKSALHKMSVIEPKPPERPGCCDQTLLNELDKLVFESGELCRKAGQRAELYVQKYVGTLMPCHWCEIRSNVLFQNREFDFGQTCKCGKTPVQTFVEVKNNTTGLVKAFTQFAAANDLKSDIHVRHITCVAGGKLSNTTPLCLPTYVLAELAFRQCGVLEGDKNSVRSIWETAHGATPTSKLTESVARAVEVIQSPEFKVWLLSHVVFM